jgi:hypothetical protein
LRGRLATSRPLDVGLCQARTVSGRGGQHLCLLPFTTVPTPAECVPVAAVHVPQGVEAVQVAGGAVPGLERRCGWARVQRSALAPASHPRSDAVPQATDVLAAAAYLEQLSACPCVVAVQRFSPGGGQLALTAAPPLMPPHQGAQVQAAQRALSAERAALESLKADLGSGRRLSAVGGPVHSGAAADAAEERELPVAVSQSDASPRRRRVSLISAPPFALDDPEKAPPPLPFGAQKGGAQPGGVFLSSLANLHGNRPSLDEAAAKEEARRAYVADLNAQVAAKQAAKRAQKAQEESWERRHGASPPPPQLAMRRQSAVERRDDPVPSGLGRHVQFTQPELGAGEPATGAGRSAAARGPVPMHLQSSVFGESAARGPATSADGVLPSARHRGGAIHAELVAGPSDAQKVEAEARRRRLVADLDAQVVQRRADAAARKKAELAAEEEAERQYVAALAAERAKMEKERAPAGRPMSADSPTGISARPRVWDVQTPEAVPTPPPARVSRASGSVAPVPVVAAQPPAPPPSSDDGPASREALAMLRLLREEQVRMRDELAAMRQQQSVTRAPRRSSLTHSFDDDSSSFLVDTAHMPVDASLDMASGVLRPPPAAAQAPAAQARSRGAPAQRLTPRRSAAEKGAWAPPAKTRGGWAPPPVPPPSVQRAQQTPRMS